jgi:ankyrin repeat protein
MFSYLHSPLFGNARLRLAAERFRLAAARGDLEEVQQLYSSHGRSIVNARGYDGWTALHMASFYGKLDVVKYLVEVAEASIRARTDGGKTPLLFAPFGSLELVKYLVEKADKSGETILHYASWNGGLDIVKYLVEQCRANVHAVSKDGETLLHSATSRACMLEKLASKYWPEDTGRTTHHASLCAQLQIIGYLVNVCGVDMHSVNRNGFTPLQLACDKGCVKTAIYLVGQLPPVQDSPRHGFPHSVVGRWINEVRRQVQHWGEFSFVQ